jgi:phosphohistidine phosphatase
MATSERSLPGKASSTAILLRHAHAQWPQYQGSDFDRPLTPRGWQDARAAARAIRAAGQTPGLVLASPARRTRETAAALQAECAIADQDLRFVAALYNAPADVLKAELRAALAQCERVTLVAHNPGLSELALRLAGQSGGPPLAPADWRCFALPPQR